MDSFIGASIQLVSKSEVRYTGILSHLDPTQGNIALTQVRSFGTENRKPPHETIPSSDVIYEYIIFRSSDIKDIQVLNQLPSDPAILSMSKPQSFPAPPPQQTPLFPSQPGPVMPQFQPQAFPSAPPAQTQILSGMQQQQQQQQKQPLANQKMPSPVQKSPAATTPVEAPSIPAVTTLPSEPKEQQSHQRNERQQQQQQNQKKPAVPSNNGSGGRANGSNYRTNNNSNSNSRGNREHQKLTVPQSDYDFESANAKFVKEVDEQQQPEEQFYQKSSFFDNISCSSKEKTERRAPREERKLNIETFGTASPRGGRGRGRGRGRGGYYHNQQNRSRRNESQQQQQQQQEQ